MNRAIATGVLLCLLGMSSQALAQTSSTTTSTTGSTTGTTTAAAPTAAQSVFLTTSSIAFPAEQYIFNTMSASEQDAYMKTVLFTNQLTQQLTAAAYNTAERKVRDSDPLTSFDRYILARGPFPLLPGNPSVVPIGPQSSSSTSTTTTATQ